MNARKPRKAAKLNLDLPMARVLEEAEESLRFGMMMLIRSHAPTTQRPAECRLTALACFEEAASKIGTARMWQPSVDGSAE